MMITGRQADGTPPRTTIRKNRAKSEPRNFDQGMRSQTDAKVAEYGA